MYLTFGVGLVFKSSRRYFSNLVFDFDRILVSTAQNKTFILFYNYYMEYHFLFKSIVSVQNGSVYKLDSKQFLMSIPRQSDENI